MVKASIGALIISVLIAHIVLPLSNTANIYPLFNWHLFSNVAEAGRYYDLKIILADDSSCYFSSCEKLDLGRQSTTAWNLIQQLGRNYTWSNEDDGSRVTISNKLRHIFHATKKIELVRIKGFLSEHIVEGGKNSQVEFLATLQPE